MFSVNVELPSGYLTVRHGKSPFLSSVNHLFRLGPPTNHGYVNVIEGKETQMSVTWLPGLPGWLMDGTSVLLVLDWCSPYRYLAGGAGGTALAP